MIEVGKVIDIENGNAKVYIDRQAACGDCGACQIGRDNLNMIINVENRAGAKIGDFVEIQLNTENFLTASFILYGIPLLGLIFGISIGYYGFKILGYSEKTSQVIAAVLGLLLLSLSYLIIKSNEFKIKEIKKFKPLLVKIIDKGQ